jgi:uncharacterized protein
MGIDDSPLSGSSILVVGAIMRGSSWLEGIVSTHIERDGLDATDRLACMVNGTKHRGQVRALMLNGVTMGGFNVVDIDVLCERTGLPVIVMARRMPDMEKIHSALQNLDEPEKRYEIIKSAGAPIEVRTIRRGKPIYIQYRGIEKDDAVRLVVDSAIHSRIPEPVRVAHMIATGVILGESSKRV